MSAYSSITHTAPTLFKFNIDYDFHLGAGDNGNVYGITNDKDSTRNQTFTYDLLNRLISAQNAGTDCTQTILGGNKKFWGNTYNYDAWGNLLAKAVSKCSSETLSVVAGVNNRISTLGYVYDAAGNMTNDGLGNSYTFDLENRITGAGGYTYTYDGDGNRVKKANGATASSGTLYWYMTPGIVAESDLAGTLKSEYVFFGGERVARRDLVAPAGVFYYFSDHLKTASVITDAIGNIVSESDYYPWGGELQFVNNDSNHYKFTGKERDGESGLDYFGARYYSNGLGRFISADWSATPISVPYADFDDPQTLNLFGYVRGLPTTRADWDGHDWRDELKGAVIGTGNFVGHTVKAVAILAIPVYGPQKAGQAAGDAIVTAVKDYYNKGASGVMNEVLDLGPQGAMEVVTEAVLTGGLAASGRVSTRLPEGTVTRYMGPGEASTAKATGEIPNTDAASNPRPTHVTTDEPTGSATVAQTKYELGTKPTHRATVPASRAGKLGPTPDGKSTTSGGGSQAATNRAIPVKPREIKKLKD